MHLNENNMRRALDYLASRASLAGAARSINASDKLLFNWLRRSAAGDPKLLVRWPDSTAEPIQFVEATKLARRMHIVLLESNFRARVDEGYPRVVIDGGKVQHQIDNWQVANFKDAADAERLGFTDWPYKHDERGARLPLIVHDPLPAMAVVHALKSLIPGTYNPAERRETDTRISGGVMILGAPKAKPQEQKVMPEQSNEAAALPASTDTPLVADLKRRLAELQEHGPANPLPRDASGRATIPSVKGHTPDDDIADDKPEPPKPAPQRLPGRPAVDHLARDLARSPGMKTV